MLLSEFHITSTKPNFKLIEAHPDISKFLINKKYENRNLSHYKHPETNDNIEGHIIWTANGAHEYTNIQPDQFKWLLSHRYQSATYLNNVKAPIA